VLNPSRIASIPGGAEPALRKAIRRSIAETSAFREIAERAMRIDPMSGADCPILCACSNIPKRRAHIQRRRAAAPSGSLWDDTEASTSRPFEGRELHLPRENRDGCID